MVLEQSYEDTFTLNSLSVTLGNIVAATWNLPKLQHEKLAFKVWNSETYIYETHIGSSLPHLPQQGFINQKTEMFARVNYQAWQQVDFQDLNDIEIMNYWIACSFDLCVGLIRKWEFPADGFVRSHIILLLMW